jgi:putative nucleotidyltransferase with HDIG domain
MDEAAQPSFRFLQQLAIDISKREISFPTFIDATLRVRRALNNPKMDTARVARAIGAEPLLAARIMHVANSAGLGPPGAAVGDLKAAILRLGYSTVKSVATSVAMAQLAVAKDMRPFLVRGAAVWRHSLDVAAIAHVLARKLTRLNPDEALFCGLVHDIGHFYLLSRVSKYPELAQDSDALDAVLEEWHAPIGHAVLGAFELPEAVLTAVAEHHANHYPNPLRKLSDVIVAANLLSHCPNPLNRDAPAPLDGAFADPAMSELLESSADELTSLVAAFRA